MYLKTHLQLTYCCCFALHTIVNDDLKNALLEYAGKELIVLFLQLLHKLFLA